jgi:hypothetical protein
MKENRATPPARKKFHRDQGAIYGLQVRLR